MSEDITLRSSETSSQREDSKQETPAEVLSRGATLIDEVIATAEALKILRRDLIKDPDSRAPIPGESSYVNQMRGGGRTEFWIQKYWEKEQAGSVRPGEKRVLQVSQTLKDPTGRKLIVTERFAIKKDALDPKKDVLSYERKTTLGTLFGEELSREGVSFARADAQLSPEDKKLSQMGLDNLKRHQDDLFKALGTRV